MNLVQSSDAFAGNCLLFYLSSKTGRASFHARLGLNAARAWHNLGSKLFLCAFDMGQGMPRPRPSVAAARSLTCAFAKLHPTDKQDYKKQICKNAMPRNICSPPRGRGTVQRGSAPGPLSPNVLCTHRCIAASLHRFGTCSNASRSIVDRSLGLGIKLNTRENPSENPSSSSENPPAALLCLSLARELRILLPKKK